MATTITDKIVITRKPHVCFSCLRVMASGIEMRSWTVVHEGKIHSGYYCHTCDDIILKLDHECDEINEGYVKDMLRDGETPEQFLKSLDDELIDFVTK
jgi:hypothetical protein